MLRYLAVFALVAVTLAQDFDFDAPRPAHRPAPARIQPGYSGPTSAPRPAPVAIIKQINRHNDDGSYTYGYESADGSFKIETKNPTGEVKGKYGYVDDVGKVRVIEYGATKHGFAPSGEGITVPPPTLVDETTDRQGALLPEYTGAYNQPDEEPEQQQSYGAQQSNNRPRPILFSVSEPSPAPRPAPVEYSPPQTFEPAPRPAPRPQAPASTYSLDFPSSPIPSRPAFSSSPVPQRPAFANAAPVSADEFGSFASRSAPQPQRPAPQPSFAPAPITRPAPQAPQYRPAPQQAPQYRPAPQQAPQYRPAPQQAPRQGGGSILDQLSKEYALPEGNSAPLHDISFGYY